MKEKMSNKEYYARKLLDCYNKEQLLGDDDKKVGCVRIWVSSDGQAEVECNTEFFSGTKFGYGEEK